MRLKYIKSNAVDGDTVRVTLRGSPGILMRRYIRIVGVDTDEINDPNSRKRIRAIHAKEECQRQLNRCVKPRFYAQTAKSHDGEQYVKDHNGRLLCVMKIWKWSLFKWVDYADNIISNNLHKKNSRWNKEIKL